MDGALDTVGPIDPVNVGDADGDSEGELVGAADGDKDGESVPNA